MLILISLDLGQTTSTSSLSTIDKISANLRDDLKLDLSRQDLADADLPVVIRYAFENKGVRIEMFVFKRIYSVYSFTEI